MGVFDIGFANGMDKVAISREKALLALEMRTQQAEKAWNRLTSARIGIGDPVVAKRFRESNKAHDRLNSMSDAYTSWSVGKDKRLADHTRKIRNKRLAVGAGVSALIGTGLLARHLYKKYQDKKQSD